MLQRERFGFGSASTRFGAPRGSDCIGADCDRHVASAFARVASPSIPCETFVTAVKRDIADRPSSATPSASAHPPRPSSAMSSAAEVDRADDVVDRSAAATPSVVDGRRRPGSALSLVSASVPDVAVTAAGRVRPRRPASAEYVALLQRRRSASDHVRGVRAAADAQGEAVRRASSSLGAAASPAPGDTSHVGHSLDRTMTPAASAPSFATAAASIEASPPRRVLISPTRPSTAAAKSAATTSSTPWPRFAGDSTTRGLESAKPRCHGGFGFRHVLTKDAVVQDRVRSAKAQQGAVTGDAAASRRVENAMARAGAATLTTARSPDVAVRPSVSDIAAAMRRPHSYLADAHLNGTCITLSRNKHVRAQQLADKKYKAAALRSW